MMEGKTVLITGASAGLGLESAIQLARLGTKVILAVRNINKAKENINIALELLFSNAPQNSRAELEEKLVVWPVKLNLEDVDSIRAFVDSLKNDGVAIDVLMNNAGCMMEEKQLSKEGVEWTFAVNQLGPFLLTILCIPLLLKTPSPRIVILSSSLHKSGGETFDWDDINWEKRKYNGMRVYSESKFANQLFSYALHRRVKDKIAVFSVHPGVVRTELGRNISWWKKIFFIPIAYTFFKSPADGAKTQVFCCSSDDVINESGKYFGNCKSETSSKESLNEEYQENMWNLSVKLSGVTEEELSVLNVV